MELTVFIVIALIFCIIDIRRMRGDGARRDLPPYIAAVAAAVCTGAVLIAGGGEVSVIRLIDDIFHIGV
jgi:hypothetical protein